MTKEEKKNKFKPKLCALYKNGEFYSSYPSKSVAKKVMHFKKKESYDNWDDDEYEIRPYNPVF